MSEKSDEVCVCCVCGIAPVMENLKADFKVLLVFVGNNL